jgi:flagellar biogenesis protein FliO
MFVLLVVLRKTVLKNQRGGIGEAEIEVLGRRTLQPKQAILVVRVMGKVLVVGVTDHGMQTLSEITDPAALAALDAGERAGSVPGVAAQPFTAILRNAVRGVIGKPVPSRPASSSAKVN